jgi:cellulose biosynthesis protein BcsQ
MPKLIAVTNPKGGTGKSTTTAALASLAARDGFRTLLIDLDPQQTVSFLSRGEWETDADTAAAMFLQSNAAMPSSLASSLSDLDRSAMRRRVD